MVKVSIPAVPEHTQMTKASILPSPFDHCFLQFRPSCTFSLPVTSKQPPFPPPISVFQDYVEPTGSFSRLCSSIGSLLFLLPSSRNLLPSRLLFDLTTSFSVFPTLCDLWTSAVSLAFKHTQDLDSTPQCVILWSCLVFYVLPTCLKPRAHISWVRPVLSSFLAAVLYCYSVGPLGWWVLVCVEFMLNKYLSDEYTDKSQMFNTVTYIDPNPLS